MALTNRLCSSENDMSSSTCQMIKRISSPSTSYADSLVLRKLRESDRSAVEELCLESFPIQYPDCWFDEVVAGSLTSIGLFEGNILAAMIVSEMKPVSSCNPEDQDILSEANSQVVYILSLAVSNDYRRMGLATRLLDDLFATVINQAPYPRAVFLHVLSTNAAALSFYKMHGFQWHASLINYYRIDNEYGDGCTYVKYTNGSRPPATFYELVKNLGTTICLPLKAICRVFSF